MLSAIFEQFVEESPISVMARGLMERVFAPERMDKLFENHARVQYQQDLLFSSQIDLMSLVVCGVQKSVHAAYKAKAADLIVSTTALYKKLSGVELGVSQALVRETAQELQLLISKIGGEQPNPLPGYQVRIVDGTCLGATDHRLEAIRLFAAKALPGKAIVVLDPGSKLVRDKEWEIAILTNLPQSDAPAAKIAQLYRQRWSLETLFQTVTENFQGEIQTLAYPKAALFSFSLALVTYNILATVKAALGSVHGVGKIDAGLSDFYLVNEITSIYRGMMIGIPANHWQVFQTLSLDEMALVLQSLAARVKLQYFLKAMRGVKKKREPLIVDSKHCDGNLLKVGFWLVSQGVIPYNLLRERLLLMASY